MILFDWFELLITGLENMEEENKRVCEELDNVVLEVMASLKRLSLARDQYSSAVREVSII